MLVGVAGFALLLVGGPLAGGEIPWAPQESSADPRTSASRETQPAVRPSEPRELRVPSVGIEATVRPVSVGDDLVLRPPREPELVGWWDESAEPGVRVSDPGASGAGEGASGRVSDEAAAGPRGGTVIAGHTVHDARGESGDESADEAVDEAGGGAMDRLPQVAEGARVVVRTRNGEVRYRVSGVRHYTKKELAERAETIFDQRRAHRLVLVTCDDWNGVEYLSNVVIVAQPLPAAA